MNSGELNLKIVSEVDGRITEDGLRNSSTKEIPPYCVLVGLAGQGKTRGTVAINTVGLCTNQSIAAIFPNDTFEAKYLFYNLENRYLELRNLSTGEGGRGGLNLTIIRNIPVPLPPLAEQRAIAAALSDVDGLLTALAELIAKKRAIKQAAMQQLLTGQTRLPGFSGEWKKLAFDDVFSCINSKSFQIQTNEYHEWGVYPIVDQGKNLIAGYSDRIDKLLKCPPGGLIVFGDHTCIVKYVDFDFVVGADGTQILTATPGQILQFHAYQLVLSGVLPTGYNRHFKYLRDRTFFAPIENEQRAITSILADMDAEISALEAQRAKVQALKQGMLQELLTGRTRLV